MSFYPPRRRTRPLDDLKLDSPLRLVVNNPGKFDCYEAAGLDEPMFILLARDPLAPMLVDLWAKMRAHSDDPSGMTGSDKTLEAEQCAQAMREWRVAKVMKGEISTPRDRTIARLQQRVDDLEAERQAQRDVAKHPADLPHHLGGTCKS